MAGTDHGAMVIPYERLSPEALHGVIEEFVTRDGTDLDDAEAKIAQIMEQLRRGLAVITFDERTGSCNIVPAAPPDPRRAR